MTLCIGCNEPILPTGKRGRPRRICVRCIPPLGEISKTEYNRRYEAIVSDWEADQRARWHFERLAACT